MSSASRHESGGERGKVVIEGKSRSVMLEYAAGAVIFTVLAFILVFLIFTLGPVFLPPDLIMGLAMCIVGAAICLGFAARMRRPRRFEIDGTGIRFYSAEELEWEVPWNGLQRIEVADVWGKDQTDGFYLWAGAFPRFIATYNTIGPLDTIKVVFREVARRAGVRGVVVDDCRGWAGDLYVPFAGPAGWAGAERLAGSWHASFDPNFALKRGLAVVGVIMALGVLISLVSLTFGTMAMVAFLLPGIFILPFVLAFHLRVVKELMFDKGGIHLKLCSGAAMDRTWDQVRAFGTVQSRGQVRLLLAGDLLYWRGFFSLDVMESARRMFARCRSLGQPLELAGDADGPVRLGAVPEGPYSSPEDAPGLEGGMPDSDEV